MKIGAGSAQVIREMHCMNFLYNLQASPHNSFITMIWQKIIAIQKKVMEEHYESYRNCTPYR